MNAVCKPEKPIFANLRSEASKGADSLVFGKRVVIPVGMLPGRRIKSLDSQPFPGSSYGTNALGSLLQTFPPYRDSLKGES